MIYQEGTRVALCYYHVILKTSEYPGKVGKVLGRSEKLGGFSDERVPLVRVLWDGDERPSTVHPDNLRVVDR